MKTQTRQHHSRSPWRNSVLQGAILLLIIAGLAAMQRSRLQAFLNPQGAALSEQAQTEARQLALQLSLLKNLPDFGFRNLVADWAFLQFLQYFGNYDFRQETGYGLSADFFDIVIDRDPYSYLPYLHLSSSVSLFAAQPERAVALQEKGLESLSPGFPPKAYFIWRNKGIDEILFLDDFRAATESHIMAAQWAAQTPGEEAQEDQYSLLETAEFIATNPDRTNVQVSAWIMVLTTAPDDQARGVAVDNLRDLGFEATFKEDGGISVLPIAPDAPATLEDDDS
jgi:hypothetical protein